MAQHPHQRVGVFIDVQNMYHSCKHLYNAKVNFGQVVKTALADRQLVRAMGYVSVSQAPDEAAFFEALYKQGIELKMKDLQVFPDGTKKGDWDVGIAVDCIAMSHKLDVIVLVTGDGDFMPLVEYLSYRGVTVELVSFGKSTSARLIESVHSFYDLDQDVNKHVIRGSASQKAGAEGNKPRNASANNKNKKK